MLDLILIGFGWNVIWWIGTWLMEVLAAVALCLGLLYLWAYRMYPQKRYP
jgi:hypothetical protein